MIWFAFEPCSRAVLKKLILAIMFITGLALEAANAADGCGVGCHGTVYGACVVDGWTVGVFPNECPAAAAALSRQLCPRGYILRSGACSKNGRQ